MYKRQILDGMWWTIDRHLTNEQTRQSARATYLDSIKNGVTTVFDHHASFGEIHDSLFAIEDAAKEMGIRTCLCYEVSDRDGMDKARAAVMENAAWIKHALADETDMLAGMMGMHAQFTISDETMEPVSYTHLGLFLGHEVADWLAGSVKCRIFCIHTHLCNHGSNRDIVHFAVVKFLSQGVLKVIADVGLAHCHTDGEGSVWLVCVFAAQRLSLIHI